MLAPGTSPGLLHRVSCERDNRQTLAGSVRSLWWIADVVGLQAIHLRHLQVHEGHVETLPLRAESTSRPFEANTTLCPFFSRRRSVSFWFTTLSSTNSTRRPGRILGFHVEEVPDMVAGCLRRRGQEPQVETSPASLAKLDAWAAKRKGLRICSFTLSGRVLPGCR